MMKDLMFHQQIQQQQQEENMSNLTSASGEQASVSSGNNAGQHFAPPSQAPPAKKKRNLPGNPDPDAEVVSLSPKTLVTTNRFVCEICSKGFQRDQNLQLHRRGHNLPWKLKQRTSKEVKKKVYVCPEPTCVHHDPSRALGDLTGIKKHYYRKHGEKKWKCDKCSKRYAVQSDWKAHSKTCGTREYRCDCGTIFSRRDSFITHRAFCDALAEESARAITGPNPLHIPSSGGPSSSSINLLFPHREDHQLQAHGFSSPSSSLKKEHLQFQQPTPRAELPPWLAFPPGHGPGPPPHQPNIDLTSPTSSSSSSRLGHHHHHRHQDHLNPNPSVTTTSLLPSYPSLAPSPHMSATALLQKAAQMGATISSKTAISTPTGLLTPHQHPDQPRGLSSVSLLQDMMNSFSSPHHVAGFDGTSFEDAFVSGVLKKDRSLGESLSVPNQRMGGNSRNGSGGSDGLTRDFLGLRPLPQSDIFSMAAGLGNCINNNSSNDHTNQPQKPW